MNAPLHSPIDAFATQQEAPSMWLRRLWERMVSMYGHAWTSAHCVTPHEESGALSIAGDTWSRALAGLSTQQIAAGIEACLAEGAAFPPSAPRFRAMCMSIPSFATVRVEIHPQGNPSRFTRAVWSELDTYRYRQSNAEQADRMLRETYDMVRERVMRGGSVPEAPAAAIEHEKREPKLATPEQVSAYLVKINLPSLAVADVLMPKYVCRQTTATRPQAGRICIVLPSGW